MHIKWLAADVHGQACPAAHSQDTVGGPRPRRPPAGAERLLVFRRCQPVWTLTAPEGRWTFDAHGHLAIILRNFNQCVPLLSFPLMWCFTCDLVYRFPRRIQFCIIICITKRSSNFWVVNGGQAKGRRQTWGTAVGLKESRGGVLMPWMGCVPLERNSPILFGWQGQGSEVGGERVRGIETVS